MFSILLIIIPLLIQNQVYSSPVLLWSNANLPESSVPLSTLSPLSVITNYICKLTNKQIQLRLYAVDDLKQEDILISLKNKNSLLVNAKNEPDHYRYIPNVGGDVYHAFSLMPQSNNLLCGHIHFEIASLNIYQTLNSATDAMQKSINDVGTTSDIITVMALINGPIVVQKLTRERRDLEIFEDEIIVSDDKSCMFYADTLTWTNGSIIKNYTLDIEHSTCTPNKTKDDQNATVTTLQLMWVNGTETLTMTLLTKIIGQYWYLQSTEVNGQGFSYFAYGLNNSMDTPPTYSYVCPTATFVAYNSVKHGSYNFEDKISITRFQFQPFNGNGSYFGLPNYCTSFFTSGIWMGITSSFVCLAILLFGITRIMSIKSNDRFDDPKGKPLVIKAQE